MSREPQDVRHCVCGARLARDNRAGRCAACSARTRLDPASAPEATVEFWEHPEMRDALTRRHMGHVIRVFRTHPDHGRNTISQETAAGWAGITQAQLSRIENGSPIVHLDRLVQWAQTLRIPPEYLWFKMPDGGNVDRESDNVNRTDFLRLSGTVAAGGIAARLFAGLPVSQVSAQDCAQWLAWELWSRGTSQLHGTELPVPVAKYLEPHTAGIAAGEILRDAEGFYSFAHPSLVDFHVARRIFTELAQGDSRLFATAQTTHDTDLVLREFVKRDETAANTLRRWMAKAPSPVLRVNSAGVLAKVGARFEDEVVRSLKRDSDSQQLYLTAVASRVLELPWDTAGRLATSVTQGHIPDLWSESRDRAGRDAARLAAEVSNPRDGAARWCSVVLLGNAAGSTPGVADVALHTALRQERNPETIRSIGALLSGESPLSY